MPTLFSHRPSARSGPPRYPRLSALTLSISVTVMVAGFTTPLSANEQASRSLAQVLENVIEQDPRLASARANIRAANAKGIPARVVWSLVRELKGMEAVRGEEDLPGRQVDRSPMYCVSKIMRVKKTDENHTEFSR